MSWTPACKMIPGVPATFARLLARGFLVDCSWPSMSYSAVLNQYLRHDQQQHGDQLALLVPQGLGRTLPKTAGIACKIALQAS